MGYQREVHYVNKAPGNMNRDIIYVWKDLSGVKVESNLKFVSPITQRSLRSLYLPEWDVERVLSEISKPNKAEVVRVCDKKEFTEQGIEEFASRIGLSKEVVEAIKAR